MRRADFGVAAKFSGNDVATRLRRLFIGAVVASSSLAWAGSGSWIVDEIRPPGANDEAPRFSVVAASGSTVFIAYAPDSARGYRLYVRERSGGLWSAPQLVAEGSAADGDRIHLSADGDRLAVGLASAAAGEGRVDVWSRKGGAWVLSSQLSAASRARLYGTRVSLRGEVLVVSGEPVSGGGGYFETLRWDDVEAGWIDAGYTGSSIFLFDPVPAATDGERVAQCWRMQCVSVLPKAGVWNHEAAGDLGDSSTGSILVDGEWLFVGSQPAGSLAVGLRSGSNWQSTAVFPARSFAASSGRLVTGVGSGSALRGRIHERNYANAWVQVLDLPMRAVGIQSVALGDDLAVFGEQAAVRGSDGNWLPAGNVAAEPDAGHAYFGTAIAAVGDDVWIGSPGSSSTDLGSGAVFTHPMAPSPSDSVTMLPGFPSPAVDAGLGRAMATDGSRVVVAARSATDGRTRLLVYATSPVPAVVAEIEGPATPGALHGMDVDIDGSTVAFTRRFSDAGVTRADVHVFRANPGGYVPAGVIELPADAPASDAFGYRVHVAGDWLLAGRWIHHWSGGEYGFVDELAVPPGTLVNLRRASMSGARLVVLAFGDQAPALLVYDTDAEHGWSMAGSAAFESPGMAGCTLTATDGSRVACVATEFGPEYLYMAQLPPAGAGWSVPLAGPYTGILPYPVRSLAISGERVFLGIPETGSEPAGSYVGRVVVAAFDEGIFTHGFD